jgi:putative aldouronate transport system permease protein
MALQTKWDRPFQLAINTLLALMSAMAAAPILLLIISSFASEGALIRDGYSFFPSEWSAEAYLYLWHKNGEIVRAYGITLFITAAGTAASLLMTPMLAYPLSRPEFRLRNPLSFFVFFTMLFNGGIVPSYIMWTQGFGVRNTIWALLVPSLLMNAFNVILVRNYFSTNIPGALIEAARIDGAGELFAFFRIVLPLSLPIMATVGLFTALAYWNDWTNGLYYVTQPRLFSLQNYLNRILQDVQFLASSSVVQQSGAIVELPAIGIRMAISVIGLLPILIVYPFFQKFFVKGIVIGAVKG